MSNDIQQDSKTEREALMNDWYKKQESTPAGGGDNYWDRRDKKRSEPGRSAADRAKDGDRFFSELDTSANQPPMARPTVAKRPAAVRPVAHPGTTVAEVPVPPVVEEISRQRPALPGRMAMLTVLGAIVILAGIAAVGLTGGDDQDPTTGPVTTEPVTPPDSTTAADPIAATPCPDLAGSLEQANAATYVVAAEYQPPGTGADLLYFTFGTAWAVESHVLVTNAHVTQAFIDLAADGVQFERVLAVQAGTGRVVNLTRELPHPNYDGDPLKSPDVGLFTTLESLPTILRV